MLPCRHRSSPSPWPTPGLLAHILTAKFVDHLPFYRQEKQYPALCSWPQELDVFRHSGGSRGSALLYIQVKTARANILEPYGYLRYFFTRLPLATTKEDYKALLLWNISRKQLDSAAGSVPGG